MKNTTYIIQHRMVVANYDSFKVREWVVLSDNIPTITILKRELLRIRLEFPRTTLRVIKRTETTFDKVVIPSKRKVVDNITG